MTPFDRNLLCRYSKVKEGFYSDMSSKSFDVANKSIAETDTTVTARRIPYLSHDLTLVRHYG